MTKLRLVASSLRHRRGRTALAMGCFALTSMMCAATFTLTAKSSILIGGFPSPRVIVEPYDTSQLTLAHVEAIRRLPGVRDVEYQLTSSVHVGDSRAYTLWATSDGIPTTLSGKLLSISSDVERAWREDRRGIVTTRSVAESLHWAPGSLVNFADEEGEVHGRLDGYIESRVPLVIGHFEHLTHDHKTPALVTRISIGCELDGCSNLIHTIDTRFEGEAIATFSMTQEDFFRSVSSGASDSISQLFGLVGAAILAVTAIVIGSSLSIGLRERLPEFATLRALGFHRSTIFGLLLTESASSALAGGLLGAVPLYLMTHWHPISLGEDDLVRDLVVSSSFALMATFAAVLLGALVCILPALQSARHSIIEGLSD
jgi:putative ABC transport system permease protein